MNWYFRAVAIDYDGTLTSEGRPADDVLGALGEVRGRGCKVILVTGRILAELRAVFPDCADHFDLVVAENGAIVAAGSLTMRLAPPIPREIDRPLAAAGVVFRRGEVIVATSAAYEVDILQEIRRCGFDCQLTRNRKELMLVPVDVSKATGLRYALLQLGISSHSTIAIGDAENDLAMLDACEVAVAVGNAVDSVKSRADVVLSGADGGGVSHFLRSAVLGGALPPPRQRWSVTLGRSPGGEPVRFPASGVDVIIAGGTGSGKSFATGLIAEQLVQLGYIVCVFDPEGDHAPLGRLPNVVTLGGRDRTPAPQDLAQIFEQSGTSVVVDLALVSPRHRDAWTLRAIEFLEKRRAETGVPHWLVIDEAHTPLGHGSAVACFDGRLKGHCLVTYQPAQLAGFVTGNADYALLVAGQGGIDPAGVCAVSDAAGLPLDAFALPLDSVGRGEALLVRVDAEPEVQRVVFAPRWIAHVRHWHKYASAHLPAERRFYFRGSAALTGAVAGNMEEFHREVQRASLATIRQHAKGGDFSRWVGDVFQDSMLASALRLSEARLCAAGSEAEAEAARREVLAAIERRYAAAVR